MPLLAQARPPQPGTDHDDVGCGEVGALGEQMSLRLVAGDGRSGAYVHPADAAGLGPEARHFGVSIEQRAVFDRATGLPFHCPNGLYDAVRRSVEAAMIELGSNAGNSSLHSPGVTMREGTPPGLCKVMAAVQVLHALVIACQFEAADAFEDPFPIELKAIQFVRGATGEFRHDRRSCGLESKSRSVRRRAARFVQGSLVNDCHGVHAVPGQVVRQGGADYSCADDEDPCVCTKSGVPHVFSLAHRLVNDAGQMVVIPAARTAPPE